MYGIQHKYEGTTEHKVVANKYEAYHFVAGYMWKHLNYNLILSNFAPHISHEGHEFTIREITPQDVETLYDLVSLYVPKAKD